MQCPKEPTPFLVEIPLEGDRAGISRSIVEVTELPFGGRGDLRGPPAQGGDGSELRHTTTIGPGPWDLNEGLSSRL